MLRSGKRAIFIEFLCSLNIFVLKYARGLTIAAEMDSVFQNDTFPWTLQSIVELLH